nr:MAG TPA: tail protein [Caudoviricetes sp.]
MATVTEKKVISNQVFTAIQQSKSYEAHTGTIIYANKYSGLQEVSMPETFKTILDSGLGSIGTNPLQQLRAKLEGLPGGPWFLDSRNGTIYIHNRKFQEDVVHNYVYQAENGEVLQISFETQRTSKSLSSISSGNIDPYSKNLTGSSTAITSESPGTGSKDNGTPYKSYFDVPANKLILDQHPEWGGKIPFDTSKVKLYNENTQPWQVLVDREQRANINAGYHEWKKKKEATERSYKKYKGKTGEQQAQDKVKKTSTTKKSLWSRHIIGKSGLTPQEKMNMAEEMGRAWRYAHNKKDILKIAQQYLGYGTHVIVAPVWAEQWVDPTTYSGKGMFQGKSTPASSVGSDDWRSSNPKYDYNPKKKAALKLNLMRQDPQIKVLSGIKVIKGKDSYGHKQYYFRVKVFRYHYTRTKVNAAQIVADDAVRILERYGKSSPKKPSVSISLGGGDNSWSGELGGDISENRHGNRGRRATEKKLVVNMKVIGRPSLETSQIIHIDNVGSKWSGDYYIKSVSHDMSPDSGYTCQMELQRNGSQAEIESVSVQASTEKVVKDNDTSNRSRNYTHTQTDSKSSRRDRKVYTPTRTKPTSSKPNNTKHADKK